MTKVKICGITNLEDAKLAVALGADAIGINFFAQSPRCTSAAVAQSILRVLPAHVWRVGVFVNHSAEEVEQIARLAALDTLQFHGDETEEFCAQWNSWRVIKVLRIGETVDLAAIKKFSSVADFLLFDTQSTKAYGGTGTKIPEDSMRALADAGFLSKSFLAGGLTPDNVTDVITKYQPYAVDVASGVEKAPGQKDAKLVENFIKAVR